MMEYNTMPDGYSKVDLFETLLRSAIRGADAIQH